MLDEDEHYVYAITPRSIDALNPNVADSRNLHSTEDLIVNGSSVFLRRV